MQIDNNRYRTHSYSESSLETSELDNHSTQNKIENRVAEFIVDKRDEGLFCEAIRDVSEIASLPPVPFGIIVDYLRAKKIGPEEWLKYLNIKVWPEEMEVSELVKSRLHKVDSENRKVGDMTTLMLLPMGIQVPSEDNNNPVYYCNTQNLVRLSYEHFNPETAKHLLDTNAVNRIDDEPNTTIWLSKTIRDYNWLIVDDTVHLTRFSSSDLTATIINGLSKIKPNRLAIITYHLFNILINGEKTSEFSCFFPTNKIKRFNSLDPISDSLATETRIPMNCGLENGKITHKKEEELHESGIYKFRGTIYG